MDSDSVLSDLNAFKNHRSIKNIKSKKFNLTFSFENTYTDEVMKMINNQIKSGIWYTDKGYQNE